MARKCERQPVGRLARADHVSSLTGVSDSLQALRSQALMQRSGIAPSMAATLAAFAFGGAHG